MASCLLRHLLLCTASHAQLVLDGDERKPMPSVGFGTCCRKAAKGRPLIKSTNEYLRQGGRLIDTAQMYGNHRDLAVALRESGVPREQVWLTSKVNTKVYNTRAAAAAAVAESCKELGVAYVDLMLVHGLWTLSEAQMVEVWRGLIDAKTAGTTKHIGVSNFDIASIEKLTAATGVAPAAHQ